MENDRKICSFCGEDIASDFKRCPYCGSLLELKTNYPEEKEEKRDLTFDTNYESGINSENSDYNTYGIDKNQPDETKKEQFKGQVDESEKIHRDEAENTQLNNSIKERITNQGSYSDYSQYSDQSVPIKPENKHNAIDSDGLSGISREISVKNDSPQTQNKDIKNQYPAQTKDEYKTSLSNGIKVFITVACSIIPVIGQLAGLIIAIVFMNSDGDTDKRSFGFALLIASLIVFVVSSISCCVFYIVLEDMLGTGF